MHKLLLNRLSIDLRLKPRSAFAIRSGDKAAPMLHPELPDLAVLRQGDEVFIPGSSLKGVFRSHSERLLRSVSEALACDPFEPRGQCGEAKGTAPEIHAAQCLACRTFGSTNTAGRVAFSDARSGSEVKLGQRSGVSIDRKSGGPARGRLFEMEVATSGDFDVRLHLKNVQAWQIALIAAVIDDLQDGFVRIGGATTRGLGAFEAEVRGVQHWQVPGEDAPAGVGALRAELVERYDWLADGSVACGAGAPRRGGRIWALEGAAAADFLASWEEPGWSAIESRAGTA